ncbi:hypothetical protein HanRHA438_Chr04g0200271 [Helianthus annuus]|nr:hypothetical protein HanRHA438_Chr04g0200271 [Helianthus annuus]
MMIHCLGSSDHFALSTETLGFRFREIRWQPVLPPRCCEKRWLFRECLDVPFPFEQPRRHPRPRVADPTEGSLSLWYHIVDQGRLGTGRAFVLTGFCCKLLYPQYMS